MTCWPLTYYWKALQLQLLFFEHTMPEIGNFDTHFTLKEEFSECIYALYFLVSVFVLAWVRLVTQGMETNFFNFNAVGYHDSVSEQKVVTLQNSSKAWDPANLLDVKYLHRQLSAIFS